MSAWFSILSAALALVGSALTWRAASIQVRDNIDEFINDLARQGRWYNRGAIVIFAAATLQLLGLAWPAIDELLKL
jgi:hypothetical protein